MMKVMGSVLAMVFMCGRMSWAQVIGLIFILSLVSVSLFPTGGVWSPSPFLSLSSLSVLLISLSLWLMALGFLASYGILQSRKEPTMFCFISLILLFCLVVTFSVNSFLKFYIAFECTLIPTMFLIVRWGNQPERILASMYMLMYTLAASLPLLTALLVIYFFSSSLSMVLLVVTPSLGVKLSVCLFFAFLVKLPMYMFHQWLPKAHVEAPVAGSMILAGVLLKLGAYGMFVVFYMNLSLGPMKYLLSSVALLGACVTALVCVRQSDMKALIAYASVSHMSLMLVAILAQSSYGWQGAGIMLIAHGLTSSGLFACVGGMYDNYKTRSLMLVKALLSHSPIMGLWWFLLLMSNMAAPPFINLPAEMVIIGVISSSWVLPYIIMVMGLIFVTASYSLLLFTVSSHGVPQKIMNITMINSSRMHLLMMLHLLPLGLIMFMMPLVVI